MIENGWLGKEPSVESRREVIGVCAECGAWIYFDEEEYTYGRNAQGKMVCFECEGGIL